MYESEKEFGEHEKHEMEQLEILPRIIVDTIDDFDELFHPTIDNYGKRNTLREHQLIETFNQTISEFLSHVSIRASDNTALEIALLSFRQNTEQFKTLINELLVRQPFSKIDIDKWAQEQEKFVDKLNAVRKLATGETSATDPTSFN